MSNPFDFTPVRFPDFRRKIGEWKELVGDGGIEYVKSAAEYISMGNGLHKATAMHEALGLKTVEITFIDLKVYVVYTMNDNRREMLEFDIDFGGFGN